MTSGQIKISQMGQREQLQRSKFYSKRFRTYVHYLLKKNENSEKNTWKTNNKTPSKLEEDICNTNKKKVRKYPEFKQELYKSKILKYLNQ